MDNSAVVLNLEGVTKRFPGTLAVDNVDFTLNKGEVHALVGENGAGKSTLMKLIAGSFNDYTGKVILNSKEVHLHTPAQSKAVGIGMIYQELSLARPISIAENLLVGALPRKGNTPFIDKAAVRSRSKELLAQVGLEHLDPDMAVSEISQCEAQLVEIAKVLGNNPDILVMDEPTSALSSEEVGRLFDIVAKLKARGIAIIYISHHLQEIFTIADRVTVMRDGKKVGTYPITETNPEHVIDLMVGRSVADFYARRSPTIGEEIFKVDDLTRWGFFHHVSFSVHAGETLAICGLAGAGRTELARAIVGVDDYHAGAVYLKGKRVKFKNMHEAISSGVAYLTENRKYDGMALKLTIAENTMSAHIPEVSKGQLYSPRQGKKQVQDLLAQLSVYPAEPNRPVNNLSGGNQQKVLMAKWLATNPTVLILDEPTRGVDIGAKEVLHKAIAELASRGNAIVLITSDLPEMVGLSDRAVIMRNGHIIGELNREEMTESSLLLAANGEGKHVS